MDITVTQAKKALSEVENILNEHALNENRVSDAGWERLSEAGDQLQIIGQYLAQQTRSRTRPEQTSEAGGSDLRMTAKAQVGGHSGFVIINR